MSRGPECTALPEFSQRTNQQSLKPPPNVCTGMDHRGRSRDVSPIALSRKANEQAIRARISVSVATPSNLHKHSTAYRSTPSPPTRPPSPPSRHAHSLAKAATDALVATTSRLLLSRPTDSPPSTSPRDPTLLRTESSSTVASLSPDPTPLGPLTPPECGDAYCNQYPMFSTSPDYYDRPPSPPRTLKDQMQVAYALDDMHLAKVLYLKLQGIEVTGDDDPRIAAVQDEDFSSSFVPPGGLALEEEDERRCRESEKRERERIKRLQREERLRACEQIWERNLRWLREENAKVARRKEEEARRKRRMEREAKEREKEREARERELELLRHTRQLRISALTQRPLLNYSALPCERQSKRQSPARAIEDDPLQYSTIPMSPSRSPSSSYSVSPPSTPDRHTLTLPRIQHELSLQHSQSLSRTVRFAEVIASMHGPLFPKDDRLSSRAQARLSPAQRDLFESLLEPTDWENGQRAIAKGKAREGSQNKQTSVQRSETGKSCIACSLTSTSPSTSLSTSAVSSSVSTVTRSNSWFSFGSRSSRSTASTALTTPSSSLLSLKSPSHLPSSLIPSLLVSSPPKSIRHSCRQPPLTPVPPCDDPLCPSPTLPVYSQKNLSSFDIIRGRPRTRGDSSLRTPSTESQVEDETGLVRRVSRSVSTLMDMAAQFQRAYVKATLFSMGTDSYSRSRSDSRSRSGSRSPSRSPWRSRRAAASTRHSGRSGKLRPEGYRALSFDVHLFLSAHMDEELSSAPQPTRTMIPLALRVPASQTLAPQSRVFALPVSPPRSPYRILQPLPGCPSLPRLRPVANPVLLRLQALQNICAGRALTWEGRAREGRMSAGKEKLVGVAWEGIGRSSLVWEVRPVTC